MPLLTHAGRLYVEAFSLAAPNDSDNQCYRNRGTHQYRRYEAEKPTNLIEWPKHNMVNNVYNRQLFPPCCQTHLSPPVLVARMMNAERPSNARFLFSLPVLSA